MSLSKQYAVDSAKLCSANEPEFLSVLTMPFPRGTEHVDEGYQIPSANSDKPTKFQTQTARQSLQELQLLLEQMNIKTIGKDYLLLGSCIKLLCTERATQ
jgi:hypothetical protein